LVPSDAYLETEITCYYYHPLEFTPLDFINLLQIS